MALATGAYTDADAARLAKRLGRHGGDGSIIRPGDGAVKMTARSANRSREGESTA